MPDHLHERPITEPLRLIQAVSACIGEQLLDLVVARPRQQLAYGVVACLLLIACHSNKLLLTLLAKNMSPTLHGPWCPLHAMRHSMP